MVDGDLFENTVRKAVGAGVADVEYQPVRTFLVGDQDEAGRRGPRPAAGIRIDLVDPPLRAVESRSISAVCVSVRSPPQATPSSARSASRSQPRHSWPPIPSATKYYRAAPTPRPHWTPGPGRRHCWRPSSA